MSEERVRWLLGINLSLLFGFYVYIIFNLALVNDDYMALYTTWLMSVGKRPNLDFNVDSYTLLFDWMTPVYFFFGDRFELIYVFRSFFCFVFVGDRLASLCASSPNIYGQYCTHYIVITLCLFCDGDAWH